MNLPRTIALQQAEFAAIEALAQRLRDLRATALDDDAYPFARGQYELAAETLVTAFTANGRPDTMAHLTVNPLRAVPSPHTVKAVCRLGLFGLIVCALWAPVVRWWVS